MALYAQGTGRNSRHEIYEIGKANLTAVSVWLGEKPFLMGANATSLDAIAYSFLANILAPPFKIAVEGSRNVAAKFMDLLRADETAVLQELARIIHTF